MFVDLQVESVEQEISRGCMDKNVKIAGNMLKLIGAIPLVRLDRIPDDKSKEIPVKPEYLNPGGSTKDRITKEMTEEAEKRGY